MPLSRRSFVQTLGAGAAGAWIGAAAVSKARGSASRHWKPPSRPRGAGVRLILSSNENPLGTPRPVLDAVRAALTRTGGRYPVAELDALSELIAQKHGVKPENVLLGSGSTQSAADRDARVLLEDGKPGRRHSGATKNARSMRR